MTTSNTVRGWKQRCCGAGRAVEPRGVPAYHLSFLLGRRRLKLHFDPRVFPIPTIKMAGKTIADRYRMTRALGDGTFGEVLLAQRLDNGERVAVKRSTFYSFPSIRLFHLSFLLSFLLHDSFFLPLLRSYQKVV